MTSGRRGLVPAAAALWLLAFLHSVTVGIDPTDESWFLRVNDRVAGGEVLYRDVFFGATPLEVWLVQGPVALVGSELLVVKAVVAAALALSALAAASCARSFGCPPRAAAVLAVLCVVVPGLRGAPGYGHLAVALTLVALAALLRWDPRGASRRWVVVAGAAAGLAFAAKHNVGTYCVLALAAAIPLLGGWSAVRRAGPPAALAAALTAFAALVPVLVTGGGPKLLEQALTGKGTYLDRAGVSLLRNMTNAPGAWWDVRGPRSFEEALLQTGFPVLVLAAVALVVAVARAGDGEHRRRLVVLGLFAAAVAGLLYPRADAAHLGTTLPAVLLVLTVAGRELLRSPGVRRAVAGVATGLAVLLTAVTLAEPPIRLATGDAVLAGVPHFRGVLVPPAGQERLREQRRLLMEAERRSSPILMLGASSGFGQLLGDLEPATPYDYPSVNAFGPEGEAETARAVRSGAIRAACVAPIEPGLAPERVDDAVRETLPERTDLGVCVLHTR